MEEAPLSYKQIADLVMNMGKRSGAAFINAECMAGLPYLHLNSLLDVILDPNEKIDDAKTIDWCKWLIAGGRTPTEFASIGECFVTAPLSSHSINLQFYFAYFQCEALIIMRNVVLCGFRMWSRIDVDRVAFRRACQFVGTVSKKAITETTISICFYRKRVVHAIVATHR